MAARPYFSRPLFSRERKPGARSFARPRMVVTACRSPYTSKAIFVVTVRNRTLVSRKGQARIRGNEGAAGRRTQGRKRPRVSEGRRALITRSQPEQSPEPAPAAEFVSRKEGQDLERHGVRRLKRKCLSGSM